jgi:hypothetical protein
MDKHNPHLCKYGMLSIPHNIADVVMELHRGANDS